MEDLSQQPFSKRGVNLMYAICLAVFIAILMVAATTLSFYHSGAYTTVKQIQTGNQYAKTIVKDSLDIISPINASDIDKYAESIKARLNAIDDRSDFSADEISDRNLGLY